MTPNGLPSSSASSAAPSAQVFLIPGFFGFANFGEMRYFAHVREALEAAYGAAGIQVAVHHVNTRPTAAVERRAIRLADEIRTLGGSLEGPIHLVGHSSGGLDARCLVAQSATSALDGGLSEELLARIHSVVTVATPHLGTPLASAFFGALGQQLLRLLAVVSLHAVRRGHLPLRLAGRVAEVVVRLGREGGLEPNAVYGLVEQVLAEFDPTRQEQIERFLDDMTSDQELMEQLLPAKMVDLNRLWRVPNSIAAGSVVIRARAPGLGSAVAVGWNPTQQAMHAVYGWLHGRTAVEPQRWAEAVQSERYRQVVASLERVTPASNDGIVPTGSQLWGEFIAGAYADHLDVVGHFRQPTHDPPHYDWLPSGSGFNRAEFDRIWNNIAAFQIRNGAA